MRKVNKDWYRISLVTDKWDITSKAVDVLRTEHNEWSVCIGENECARPVSDHRRWVFLRLREAKRFAEALGAADLNELPYPYSFDFVD